MKKRVLIACTMQIDEIMHVINKNKIKIPVIWLERKLHNDPANLHTCIQEQIDAHQDAEEIILSYGLCGNAVLGLCSDNTKLILPIFDDCICQMLYTEEDSRSAAPEKGCYYLTHGWTIDQESIVSQCDKIYEQYGKEYGAQIIQEIYAGYHSIVIIDNGTYDVEKIRGYADKAANYTGMCVKIQKGSCRVIENLLLENYDETVRIFCKGEKIRYFNSVHTFGV